MAVRRRHAARWITKLFASPLIAALATASPACFGASEQAAGEIVIGVGASQELPAPRGAIVTVGDGRVVKATDLGASVRVTGRRAGVAQVAIGRARYSVRVLPFESAVAYARIHDALEAMKGLRAEVAGGEVFVRGRLLRAEDWLELAHASGGIAPFRFAASMEPSVEAEALALVRARLTEHHLPEPALRLAPAALASLGPGQAEMAARFEAALKPFGFAVEANASVLAMEPLIRVNILVAEMRRSSAGAFGIAWPQSAQAQLVPDLLPPGSVAGAPLVVEAQAFEQSGAGKILASPNLLCRSGKEAEFFAGGEFPIKTRSFASQAVTWKKYGVMLKVKPRADAQGRMSIGLETEVSDLDRSVVVDGVPSVLANRIESHFDLRKPRTIALSGLIKSQSGDSREGLPGLSRIPILGALFGSQEWAERKTELVVFVTPTVVSEFGEGA